MSDYYKKKYIKTSKNDSCCPDSCCYPDLEPTFSFSEPISVFSASPILTVTNIETSITNLTINTCQNSLIELRGLVGWSTPDEDVLTIWRIRRTAGGPIIWEARNGIGVDSGEQSGYITSILHADNNALCGNNTYVLTAQVDPVTSANLTANINGPIVFNATAYPL